MKREDTASLYRTAEQCLLAPYDLTPRQLEGVFGRLFGHRVDYADLYFQYARSEAWSLEEGIVKSGSFNIEQGVGVRAISGELARICARNSRSQLERDTALFGGGDERIQILGKAGSSESWPGIEVIGPNPRIQSHRVRHIGDVDVCGVTNGRQFINE